MKTKNLIYIFFLLYCFFNDASLLAQTLKNKLAEINSFVLFTEKPDVSKRFYVDILDMKVKSELPGYIELEEGLTLWNVKSAMNVIFKNSHHSTDSLASKKFELYFTTEDIDSVVRKVKKAGVEMIHDLEVQPWSQRVIRFYDPDKNIVEIGEKMEVVVKRLKKQNLTDEEISKKTMFPVEVIRKILEQ